jgi:hypothetical protein
MFYTCLARFDGKILKKFWFLGGSKQALDEEFQRDTFLSEGRHLQKRLQDPACPRSTLQKRLEIHATIFSSFETCSCSCMQSSAAKHKHGTQISWMEAVRGLLALCNTTPACTGYAVDTSFNNLSDTEISIKKNKPF